MPRRRAVRIIRQAISPRLAIRILSNMIMSLYRLFAASFLLRPNKQGMQTLTDLSVAIEDHRRGLADPFAPHDCPCRHAYPFSMRLPVDTGRQIYRHKGPVADVKFSADPISRIYHQNHGIQAMEIRPCNERDTRSGPDRGRAQGVVTPLGKAPLQRISVREVADSRKGPELLGRRHLRDLEIISQWVC